MKRGRKEGKIKFVPLLVGSKHCRKVKIKIEGIGKSCDTCKLKETCMIGEFCTKENYKHWSGNGTN